MPLTEAELDIEHDRLVFKHCSQCLTRIEERMGLEPMETKGIRFGSILERLHRIEDSLP